MKIGLRGGHSPNCKGAVGFLDEQTEVRKIYYEMVPMLQAAGHTVVNCNSDAYNVIDELNEGTNKANAAGCDIYMTIHMNASGGAGNGTECWLYDGGSGTMNGIADRINANFAAKGFQNRGKKYNTGYHDLNASNMPAMIVETLFCDSQYDSDLYRKLGAKGIAGLIASGIDGKAFGVHENGSDTKPSFPVNPPSPEQGIPTVSVHNTAPGIQFTYAVRTEGGRVLPEVTNLSDYAGVQGKRITDIAIKVSAGKIRYRVHLLNGGWLPWVTGCSWKDHNNGYAGNGAVIDAIQVYYETPGDYAEKYGYQKAQYRVSPVNSNYYSWQFDTETEGGQDGYAGRFGTAIDRFQLY